MVGLGLTSILNSPLCCLQPLTQVFASAPLPDARNKCPAVQAVDPTLVHTPTSNLSKDCLTSCSVHFTAHAVQQMTAACLPCKIGVILLSGHILLYVTLHRLHKPKGALLASFRLQARQAICTWRLRLCSVSTESIAVNA